MTTENFIVYLNGPINSGKTTISKLLQNRLPETVHIEVDDLRNFANFIDIEEVIRYALEDALLITKNWINRG